MNPPATPPPIPPAVPGVGRVFFACLVPALALLGTLVLGFWTGETMVAWVVPILAFLVPAWAAWDLHRRRRAIGKNQLPNAWAAAGAGVFGGVVFCLGAIVLAFVVMLLVLFCVCAFNGGKLGG